MSAVMLEKRSFISREIQDYPPILQACHIMELMGYSEGKTYQLMRSKECPTVRDGKRMVVLRDMFWKFILNRAAKGTAFEGAIPEGVL